MTKPPSVAPRRPPASLNAEQSTPTMRYIGTLRSPASKVTMRSTLNCFARELGYADHNDIDWNHIDSDAIRYVINGFYDRGLKTQRLNTYLTAIKKCAVKAWSMGFISERTLYEIREIQGEKGYQIKRSRPLSSNEADQLFQQQPRDDYSSAALVRDNAILAILLSCGLRRAELVGLRLDSFFKKRERWWLFITGKGNKQRHVPISSRFWPHIEKWLRIRLEHTAFPSDDTVWLRVNKNGQICSTTMQDPSSIYRIVTKRFAMMFGQHEHASPHDLRRTMATLLFRADVEASIIQDLLGHTNISTTYGYIQKDEDDLLGAIDKI